MTDNVIPFPAAETVEDVLKRVMEQEGLEHVLVLGKYKCGCEYRDTTVQDGPTALWMLERAKYTLMRFDEE